MAEYIERGAVLKKMQNWHTEERLMDCVKDFPAADVVEVVRCGECLFKRPRKEYGELHCRILDAPMNNNDFCSYGERRDSNG